MDQAGSTTTQQNLGQPGRVRRGLLVLDIAVGLLLLALAVEWVSRSTWCPGGSTVVTVDFYARGSNAAESGYLCYYRGRWVYLQEPDSDPRRLEQWLGHLPEPERTPEAPETTFVSTIDWLGACVLPAALVVGVPVFWISSRRGRRWLGPALIFVAACVLAWWSCVVFYPALAGIVVD